VYYPPTPTALTFPMICIPSSSQHPTNNNNKMSSLLMIYRRNIVLCAIALVANYTIITIWTNNLWNHLLSPIIDVQQQQQQQRRVVGQRTSGDDSEVNIHIQQTYSSELQRQQQQQQWPKVKLAIYMTTHLPQKHVQYFPCWYDAIQRLEIFKYADLILYTSTPPTVAQLQQLPFQNVIVKLYNNTGYQNGAIQAMIDPFVNINTTGTWFDEYDWVIRLNPDVLIRHDTWLIQAMLNTSNDGIFHECFNSNNYSKSNPKLHSDFYAFRPKALNRQLLSQQQQPQSSTNNYTNAEYHITHLFRNIYNSKRFQFVHGAMNSRPGTCRIEGIHSPVVHTHDLWQYCPYYYNVTKDGVY
jgi:hypothetical protein